MTSKSRFDCLWALIAKIVCLIFGHRYVVAQEFEPWSRRVICPDCRGDWGMNDQERAFIQWCPELEEMYRSFGHVVHNPWRAP